VFELVLGFFEAPPTEAGASQDTEKRTTAESIAHASCCPLPWQRLIPLLSMTITKNP
jgi:hypothetical protein